MQINPIIRSFSPKIGIVQAWIGSPVADVVR